jgi:hypothetical protein
MTTHEPPRPADEREPRRGASMHSDVPTWHDVCSCEPEPRWREVAEAGATDEARTPRAR